MVACIGCQWHLRPSNDNGQDEEIVIERFDQIERLYLTTGDIAALQQMKTGYPVQTRTLIENVLKLGFMNEPDINTRFLIFFQDSTLQSIMNDVEHEYDNVDDLSEQLNKAFDRLADFLPSVEKPLVYTQIGSLDQSIVVGSGQLGISLDKYLGSDYPVYHKYGYTDEQRAMMTRQYIVPDCLVYYLLSLYPMPEGNESSHIAKTQYVVNQVMGKKFFTRQPVKEVEQYMKHHPTMSIEELLAD